MAEYLALLDRRDQLIRRCEAFLDDYDAWLMPVMPDATFIRQKQSEPLVIDGVAQPYFLRRHVPTTSSPNLSGTAVARAAVRLL